MTPIQSALACGVVVLVVLLTCRVAPSIAADASAPAPAPAPADAQQILPPVTHENLTVFLIRGADESGGHRYLTLKEALDQKKVIVHETGSVNELAVENISDEAVYIQSGEIVKGGRQDRTLATDLILTKQMHNMPIASFCVEHGRWTGRAGEEAARFASSDAIVASAELKLAANANSGKADQQRVWQSVSAAQQKLGDNAGHAVTSTTSPSSLQLTLESPAVMDKTGEYERDLASLPEDKADIVGWAYAINGKLTGGNIYSSPELFGKLWPKLLRSASTEAFAELKSAAGAGGPATRPATRPATQAADVAAPVTAADVEAFLTAAGDAKFSTRDVNARTRVKTWDGSGSVVLETIDRDGDAWVHRNYLVVPPEAKRAQGVQNAPNAPQQQEVQQQPQQSNPE